MELILIACSAKKRDGGSPNYSPSQLEGYLSKATFQWLLTLRSELAQTKHQLAGPDLGGNNPLTKLQYMPAYLRYSGIIYQRSNFAELFPRARGKKVLIISALYGVLDAQDTIQKYDPKMDEDLPNGTRLYTWWKQNLLGEILKEYFRESKPERIHDLLPESYRKAISPWLPREFDGKKSCISYDDLGQGQGSLWKRGDILRELLAS